MKMIKTVIAVTLLSYALFGNVGAAQAEEDKQEESKKTQIVLQPELKRRTINPEEIDSGDFEAGFFYGLMSVEDFGTESMYGIRLAYHISEDLFIETMYGQTTVEKTSAEVLSSFNLLTNSERDLTYYSLSIGYNILPGEVFTGKDLAFNSALYIVLGAGNTDFAGDSRFTINYGAGYSVLFRDWLALHLDIRDHIFDIDLLGSDKTTHNLEFHTGLTFYF